MNAVTAPHSPDEALLDDFVQRGSEDAFRQLAERHAGLVHGTALRLLKGDAAAAEDAAQAVFIVLAQKARSISNRAALPAWLYRTTLLVVENIRRVDARRRKHEAEAAKMAELHSHASNSDPVETLPPEVDVAISKLNPKLQDALVLHYLKGLPREDVAHALGCSLDAVHKRLSGAVEKLRATLAGQGVSLSAPGLVAALSAQALHAAPAGCAASCHAAALGAAKLAAASTVPAGLAKGAIKMLWWSQVKTVAVVTCAALALLASGFSVQKYLRADDAPLPERPPAGDAKPVVAAPLPFPVTKVIGIVLNNKTHQPIAGVQVGLYCRGPERAPEFQSDHKPAVELKANGSNLLLVPGTASQNGIPVAVTGADGSFEISFMSPLRQRLHCDLALMETSAVPCQFTAYQGETVRLDPVQLEPRQTFRVKIVDDKGNPVANSKLKISGSDYSTDQKGSFVASVVPQNGINWDITAPGFELKRQTIKRADEKQDVEIRLTPCKPVTGKVVDAQGRPVPNVRIYAGTESMGHLPNWYTESDAKGDFVLATMPENGAPTPLYPTRGYDTIGAIQHASPGQTGVVLQLYPAGSIEILVVDEKGAPMAHARPRLMSDDMSKTRWTQTDENGVAVIEGMAAGSFKLDLPNVTRDEKVPPPQPVTIQENQTTKARLVCEHPADARPVIVSGSLVDRQGQPVLHAMVMACVRSGGAFLESAPHGNSFVDADGKFELALWPDSEPLNRRRTPMWSPLEPEGDNKLRLSAVFTDGQGREYFVDSTVPWTAGTKNFDAGKLTAALDPERTVAIDSEPRVWLERVQDAQGRDIHCRALAPANPEARGLRFVVRNSGELKAQLRNSTGEVVSVTVPSIKSGETQAPVVAQFASPRKVTFTIQDEDGKPLAGARFFSLSEDVNAFSQGVNQKSSATGELTFDCASKSAGRCLIYSGLSRELYFVNIPAAETPFVQTVKIEKASAVLSGRVTDSSGKVIAIHRLNLQLNCEGRQSALEYCEVPVKNDGTYSTPLPGGVQVMLSARADVRPQQLDGRSDWKKVGANQNVTEDLTLLTPTEQMTPKPPGPPKPAARPKDSNSDF